MEEAGETTGGTRNVAAYHKYIRGMQVYKRATAASHREALALFREAVAIDPDFALAWAMLSIRESQRYRLGGQTAQNAESARRVAERALELDPSDAPLRDYIESGENLAGLFERR